MPSGHLLAEIIGWRADFGSGHIICHLSGRISIDTISEVTRFAIDEFAANPSVLLEIATGERFSARDDPRRRSTPPKTRFSPVKRLKISVIEKTDGGNARGADARGR